MSIFFQKKILLVIGLSVALSQASAASLPAEVFANFQSIGFVELIVEYDDKAIEIDAFLMRKQRKIQFDDTAVLNLKLRRYRDLKGQVDNETPQKDIRHVTDYSHLPMAVKRFSSQAALDSLLGNPRVKAVYPNLPLKRALAQSLPLVNQTFVSSASVQGAGTTVAVIDDGIDIFNPAFGSCTSPGTPASCRVVASVSFGTGSTDVTHGTNVSAIALGVAPAAQIAMVNVFSGTSAFSSDVVSGINWAVANRATYNIAAINMSLGGSSKFASPCASANPFLTPVNNARAAGIHVVAASGNSAYIDGMASPACTPGVISVGAVYDSNVGGLNWGATLCTDVTTQGDQVTCFSNSASFLTLLAPGALITAAGITEGGTSQASPHIAGAVAVLRAAYPNESLNQLLSRMTSNGVNVTDARNGITKPRLNLLAAARPTNDSFGSRTGLTGNSGSAAGANVLATMEPVEPIHAGQTGGVSTWWSWTAPASGQLSLDTHGSGFDTLLAIYTGTTLSTLVSKAANDNDGTASGNSSVLLQVQAGTAYAIAVDGLAGQHGPIALHWSLNTAAQANLATLITGPNSVSLNSTTAYTVTVSNAGPQIATNVRLVITLPSGVSYVSGPADCVGTGNSITCSIDSLGNGATLALTFNLTWNALDAPATIIASTSSDVPDTIATDNGSAIQVAIASGDTDAPTLPNWATLLLALVLFSGSIGTLKRKKAK